MISRGHRIVLIVVLLCSYVQGKDECPLQCDCTDDFAVVICRRMEKFPVFSFASNVKTLDLNYGNIRHIEIKDVKAYSNLENLYISQNPLDCDHVTMHTLKHLMRETAGLKSFDGHKIKCPRMMPLMTKKAHDDGHYHHHSLAGGGAPLIYFHHGSFSPVAVAGGIVITSLSMIGVAVACWVLMGRRRKLARECKQQDYVSKREKGTRNESDTTKHMLREGLKKQRRGSQEYPERLKSDDSILAEEEDYLKKNMKKQRSASQGYALGAESSDEECAMVEIDLN